MDGWMVARRQAKRVARVRHSVWAFDVKSRTAELQSVLVQGGGGG